MSSSNITLYFLNSSRGIRIAWLLQELGLDYNLVAADRAKNGLAPPEFAQNIPTALHKSPTIKDGELVITESGAIIDYLVEKYDKQNRLLPTDIIERSKVREWVSASEGMFMLQSLTILYTRWRFPEGHDDILKQVEEAGKPNVAKNFKWLESELQQQKEKGHDFLVGKGLTSADIAMQFSIQFIYKRKLGVNGRDGTYPLVEAWLKRTEETETYKETVKRTKFTFEGDFKQ